MKQVLFALFFVYVKTVSAQQYGAQWVIADAVSVLDFRNDTLKNYLINPVMPMFLTSANICDSSGNLLYYTNGVYIAGSDGNQILNGDSLNPCGYTYDNICCGLGIPQAALFLPKPSDPKRYYLLHFSNDTANGYLPGTLYYTLIRDSGTGVVEQKNIPFGTGVFRQGGMTACKHANGRDWWVIMGLNNSSTYFKYLVTPKGISGPDSQSIGPSYNMPLDLPYCKFSQDGSKFAVSCYEGLILIMDFDRCTGEFSNPVTIFNEACSGSPSCSGASGIEFSSNGQFLYVTSSVILNQYDLSFPQPQQDSIGIWQAAGNDEAKMAHLQLAPNGKLYASCFNGGFYFLHVVNYTDSLGTSCDYVDTGFVTLTVNSIQLPNMVNYQLVALPGPCDTILSIISQDQVEVQIQVFPNPARDILRVSYTATAHYAITFEMIDVMGQVLIQRPLTNGSTIGLDISNFASGLYLWRGKSGNAAVEKGKVSIQK